MNYCSKCGAELPDEAKFCTKCGNTIGQDNKVDQVKNEHKINKKAIYAFLAIIGVLLVIVFGSMFYSDYSEKREARLAREKFVADSLEQARNDSIQQVKQNYSALCISVWGTIGDSSMAELQFEKGAGWYVMSQDAPVDSRRILKVKSYDKKSGRLVFNAYYKGEYIGILDGIFQSDEVEVEHGFYNVIQSYSGKFKSVKGVDIDFNFHGD